jgi:hypothetical protein
MTTHHEAVDRAVATLSKPTTTDAEKVSVTATAVTGIQNSPHYGAAPQELPAAVTNWAKIGQSLGTNGKTCTDLRAQLKVAESTQRKLRVQWSGYKKQVLSTITVFCDGDIAMMQSFAVDVLHHGTPGASLPDAPSNIVTFLGKLLGEAGCEWDRGNERHWVVQWATDAANAATYSPKIPWSKRKYVLGGQPSGSHVYFRVAVQSSRAPEGHGAWSAWIAATVR